ncbi:hypothetical protein [Mycolicibacterium sp. XJ1904]
MTINTYAALEAQRAYTQATYAAPPPRLEGTVAEQAHQAAEHAQAMLPRFLERIDETKFSPEGLQDVYGQYEKTDAYKGFEKSVESVRNRRDQAAARVEHIRRELSPAGDVAAELRASRYWNQTKALLDTAKEGAFGRAQKLLANADRTELGVLLQELPSYLEAKGHAADWIDDTVAHIVPEYGKAKRQLVNAEKVHQITQHNARIMREYIASPRSYRPRVIDGRRYDPDK